jgi:hypothetical protein
MQFWLPDSVFKQIPNVKPPRNLPISHLTVTTVWRTNQEPLKVLYASDGTTAWVGMPPQSFGWAGVNSERWIAAPQSHKVIEAFAGKLQPVRPPPASTTTPSSTTRPKTTAATDGGSGSSAAWWLVGGAAVVVAGALILTLRRRSASAPRRGSI